MAQLWCCVSVPVPISKIPFQEVTVAMEKRYFMYFLKKTALKSFTTDNDG